MKCRLAWVKPPLRKVVKRVGFVSARKEREKQQRQRLGDWFPGVVHFICMSSLAFLAPSNFAVFLLPVFPLLLPIAKNWKLNRLLQWIERTILVFAPNFFVRRRLEAFTPWRISHIQLGLGCLSENRNIVPKGGESERCSGFISPRKEFRQLNKELQWF